MTGVRQGPEDILCVIFEVLDPRSQKGELNTLPSNHTSNAHHSSVKVANIKPQGIKNLLQGLTLLGRRRPKMEASSLKEIVNPQQNKR